MFCFFEKHYKHIKFFSPQWIYKKFFISARSDQRTHTKFSQFFFFALMLLIILFKLIHFNISLCIFPSCLEKPYVGQCFYTHKMNTFSLMHNRQYFWLWVLGWEWEERDLLQLTLPKDIMSDINIHHRCCLFMFLLLSVSMKADEFDDKDYMEHTSKKIMRTDEAVTDEEVY